MSQIPHDTINLPDARIGGNPYPPQSAPAQAPHSIPDFVDGSGPIFSMYLKMASEEDEKMVENWKADADGILIFTGLFSAAVASFLSVSIQDIRQDPQDTSNFYLANIYQTLADPSRSNISSSLPASPTPFSPPNYAVWVNALWFLSLVISLTCALLATLLQQWARRYLMTTQPRSSLHKRARIRAFLAKGVEKLLFQWTVETLPTLLHTSLFLFFAGLVVFLWNVDLTIFKLVLSWVGICTALYGCITLMPIFRLDNPYLTPLSLPAWHIFTGMTYLTFWALKRLSIRNSIGGDSYIRFRDLVRRYGKWLKQGMQKTIEETALNSPLEIDTRVLLWTLDSLDEDHELERFFSGLSGFRSSEVVEDPVPNLPEEGNRKLLTALAGLLNRSLSSDLLPEPVKTRRTILCMKLVNPAHNTDAITMDEHATLYLKATFSEILVRVEPRNDAWFILASNALEVSEVVLRGYAAHGDSLSLAILIHVTRQQFSHFGNQFWPSAVSSVLAAASKFNVQDTLPELQHQFCALWNQIARKNNFNMNLHTLGRIRNVYLALHQGTSSVPRKFSASTGNWDYILSRPSSYPTCDVAGHHPDSTPHIHDDFDSTSPTFAHTVWHDNPSPLHASFASTSHAPSSSVPVPAHVHRNRMDVQHLDNDMSVSASFHPTPQTARESRRSPALHQNQPLLVQPKTQKPSQEQGTSSRRSLRRSPHFPSQRPEHPEPPHPL